MYLLFLLRGKRRLWKRDWNCNNCNPSQCFSYRMKTPGWTSRGSKSNMAEREITIRGRRLSQLKVDELKVELEKRGLKKSGNKGVLIERLQEVTESSLTREKTRRLYYLLSPVCLRLQLSFLFIFSCFCLPIWGSSFRRTYFKQQEKKIFDNW